MGNINSCLTQLPADIKISYDAAIAENPSNATNTRSGRNKRSIGGHAKYWKTGRTLKIAIVRINDECFDTVKNAINQWAPYVNLTFNFVDLEDDDYQGDIRIDLSPLYNHTPGSLVGTDALSASVNNATMFLGTDYSSTNYESIVIHEFGHALGLQHEHQHPDADIPWDREKTYQVFNAQGFSRDKVDAHVFPLARDTNLTYAPYDRYSVMHYEISNECTIGDWEQSRNKQLSAGDIAFARRTYP